MKVHSVIDETVRQIGLLEKEREVIVDVSKELSILGDRDAFKQVVMILVDNVFKYSTGEIRIHAQVKDQCVQICVQDQGEGIPPEKLEHIFERFYRADEHTFVSGYGLGLPIAKVLVEAMKGEIGIESNVGEGSTVKLQFIAVTENEL